MGFHFDSIEQLQAHLDRIDANKVARRYSFKIEKYADGTCLLLIADSVGVA